MGAMETPSMLSTLVFVSVVVAVAALVAAAIMRRHGEVAGPEVMAWRLGVVALVCAAALLIPGGLAAAGMLDRYTPLPAPALLVVAVVTAGTVALAYSPVGFRLATTVPLAALVGFQTFRVPLEWVLHRLHLEAVIPVEMTYAGRNFDVVTGLTAAVLGLALAFGRPHRGVVLLWNWVGLALLLNIVVVAVLATPVPFRYFDEGPPNLLPSTFPFVWLPTFLVQAALLGHLLVFRALRHPAGSSAPRTTGG